MEQRYLYVMLMDNGHALTLDVVQRHVEHLRAMDGQGKLFACGPFMDYPGGMVILKASSIQEAHQIAQSDPFIREGFKIYSIRTLEWAHQGNNYGLMDEEV